MKAPLTLAAAFLLTIPACSPRTNNEAANHDSPLDGTAGPNTGNLPSGRITLGVWGLREGSFLTTQRECHRQPEDILEPAVRLKAISGTNACLETNAYRPAVDLANLRTYQDAGVPHPAQEKLGVLSRWRLHGVADTLVVGNVSHSNGRWAVATVPASAFNANTKAYYLIETFKVGPIEAAHGMLRIHFDAPLVSLHNQLPASNTPFAQTQSIVASVHATTRRDGSYDPLGAGMSDGMALVRGLFSIESKFQAAVVTQGHAVQQIELAMDARQIRAWLESYVSNSQERLFQASYHTTRRNCGTEILQTFTDAFGMPAPETPDNTNIFRSVRNLITARNLPDILPSHVRPALERRALLRAEAPDWNTDPFLQEVKRNLR